MEPIKNFNNTKLGLFYMNKRRTADYPAGTLVFKDFRAFTSANNIEDAKGHFMAKLGLPNRPENVKPYMEWVIVEACYNSSASAPTEYVYVVAKSIRGGCFKLKEAGYTNMYRYELHHNSVAIKATDFIAPGIYGCNSQVAEYFRDVLGD